MAGFMEHYPGLTEICDQVLGVVTVSFRVGMEAGLRKIVAKADMPTSMLHEAIREMDKDFDFTCPCTSFKDNRCER